MMAQGAKHRVDRDSSFGIDRRSAARRWDGRALGREDFEPADDHRGGADHAIFPRPAAKFRIEPAALYKSAQSLDGRQETPAPDAVGRKLPSLPRPGPARRGADNVAIARRRCCRGRILSRCLDRRRNQGIELLQRFIMEELLLRLARNSSLFLGCTQTALHCQAIFTDLVISANHLLDTKKG